MPRWQRRPPLGPNSDRGGRPLKPSPRYQRRNRRVPSRRARPRARGLPCSAAQPRLFLREASTIPSALGVKYVPRQQPTQRRTVAPFAPTAISPASAFRCSGADLVTRRGRRSLRGYPPLVNVGVSWREELSPGHVAGAFFCRGLFYWNADVLPLCCRKPATKGA